MDAAGFWQKLDRLVAGCEVVIDRPRGSAHPRYPDFVYPLDYGYLAGTMAADGAGLDVWLGSLPERRVTAVLYAVDLEKRDAEIKILIGCTAGEARQVAASHNRGAQAALLVEREPSE